jgi:hypothetical protein
MRQAATFVGRKKAVWGTFLDEASHMLRILESKIFLNCLEILHFNQNMILGLSF